MKIKILILLVTLPFLAFSQDVVGKWKTIDDDTGKAKSIVEIFEDNGKIFGKISQILTPGEENKKCTECKGDLKDKPITGMLILKDLKKDVKEWNGGTILDPNNGKVYKCYIVLENDNKLKVRGFIGFSIIGRTQYWYRME